MTAITDQYEIYYIIFQLEVTIETIVYLVMDSITHFALGACMGEAFAGPKLGRKAMLWGALAQSIPDIDFVSTFFMDTPSALLAHRGFTHSFLFCVGITPLLALAAERWHRPHNITLSKWILFFGGVVLAHDFIDAFNNYGVGWLEPFSHQRISFNAIYVADPLFSCWPVLACLVLLFVNRKCRLRRKWWRLGIGASSIYLLCCLTNKAITDTETRNTLQRQNIHYTRYFTTPAPLQNWLWYIVAGDDRGYHVGFRSIFDSKKDISFQYFPRNDKLLTSMLDHEELQHLIRFSKQFYTVEKQGDTLVFNDLRFGQMIGWEFPKNGFVFYYYLRHPENNLLVVQRGRFKGWNLQTLRALWTRIKGNQP